MDGMTAATVARMGRIVAKGIAAGDDPDDIADKLDEELDIGYARAATIARTEVVRAHAEGQLDAFEELGVEGVNVEAEWRTASDDRVCEQCSSMEGTVLTIADARDMIPVHPNCRCAFLPANVGEARNAWCPTGEGGGQDNSCSPGGGSGDDDVDSGLAGQAEVGMELDDTRTSIVESLHDRLVAIGLDSNVSEEVALEMADLDKDTFEPVRALMARAEAHIKQGEMDEAAVLHLEAHAKLRVAQDLFGQIAKDTYAHAKDDANYLQMYPIGPQREAVRENIRVSAQNYEEMAELLGAQARRHKTLAGELHDQRKFNAWRSPWSLNGAQPGHPFYGNQYTAGAGRASDGEWTGGPRLQEGRPSKKADKVATQQAESYTRQAHEADKAGDKVKAKQLRAAAYGFHLVAERHSEGKHGAARAIARKAAEILRGEDPKFNAWCPTGPGGGQDNSCSPNGGHSGVHSSLVDLQGKMTGSKLFTHEHEQKLAGLNPDGIKDGVLKVACFTKDKALNDAKIAWFQANVPTGVQVKQVGMTKAELQAHLSKQLPSVPTPVAPAPTVAPAARSDPAAQKAWEAGLNPKQARAIARWTSESTDFQARGTQTERTSAEYAQIRAAMDAAPPYEGEIHRGLTLRRDQNGEMHPRAAALVEAISTPGSVIELGKMASWSKDTKIAAAFAGSISNSIQHQPERIVMTIRSRKTKAVDIENVAHEDYRDQKEVVVDGYNRGKPLRYRIVSAEEKSMERTTFDGKPPTRPYEPVKVKHVILEEV
jgi:SPP1 gp7 family putative phage head morphogenesis protein